MDLRAWAKRLRRPDVLVAVLAVNAIGIAYGFYYYVPQFEATPAWLWPLVPDSPFAVLLMTGALAAVWAGRSNRVFNLVAAGAMVKVGVWTAFVLVAFSGHFRFSLLPDLACAQGLLGCGNLNTVLFYLHLAMALEAVMLADLLPRKPLPFALVGGGFVLVDVLDYYWPADYLGRGCPGIFPHTVPCQGHTWTFLGTVAITLGSILLLALLHRAASHNGT